MLKALNDANADYMVVGAYAVAAHGFFRYTGDLDVWVRPTPENAVKVWQALRRFGAPLSKVTQDDFHTLDVVYSLGNPPRRIDILTSVSGVDFDDAWQRRTSRTLADQTTQVIGRDDLIDNKRASNRPKDLIDLKWLEKKNK